MSADIQEQEFIGNPEKCKISQTKLDLSILLLKAKDCLSNAGKIAQQYDFCKIVEGVLCIKDCKNNGLCFVRHAWNYDTNDDIYFDATTILDEEEFNQVGQYEYTYYKCCEYTLDYAVKNKKANGFQFAYKELINFFKSYIKIQEHG